MNLTPTQHKRLFLLLRISIICILAVAFFLLAFEEGIQAYLTPKQLTDNPNLCQKSSCRLGALVKLGSLELLHPTRVRFIAEEAENSKQSLIVEYQGVLPNLFKPGKYMLAEGKIEQGVFKAQRILAKHDEYYRSN